MGKFTIYNLQFTIKIALLIFTFYILHFTFYISPIYAQEDNIGESQINPSSPFYFLKGVREVLELKFAGTTHVKAIRELEFSTRRIREVKSLIKTTRQDLIEPTLPRYLFHLRELMGIVNLKDEDFVAQVSGTIASQMTALQSTYNQVSTVSAKRSIRATVDRLTEWDSEFAEKLDKIKSPSLQIIEASKLTGCNFLSKEASASGLNEVEKAIWTERAQKCLKTKP